MSNATARQEKVAARFWVFFIMGLMSINLGVAVIAVCMAVGDPSFRPMPGYGEQSVDWQAHKEQRKASERLGWHVECSRTSDNKAIRIDIADPSGAPVSNIHGSIKLYHFTRVNEAQKIDLVPTPDQPGVYTVPVDVSKPGHWHIEIDVACGDDQRWVDDRDVDWH